MSITLQWRRDTLTNVSTFVGAAGELIIDTTNWRIHIQDGSTPGGRVVALMTDLSSISVNAQNVAGLAPSATVDTTNAANITSGVMSLTQVPTIPAAHTSGFAASATIDTTNASNISSGTLSLARLPSIPASQISGLATSATTDATNASNISSGSLANARLAAGAAVANLGFTPFNKSGDALNGPMSIGNTVPLRWENASGAYSGGANGSDIFTFNDNKLYFDQYDTGCFNFRGVGWTTYFQIAPSGVTLSTYGVGTLGVKTNGAVVSGGFVTPQMYGAAGDGTTDDTTALSNCLNSGKPVLLIGKFLISSQITVVLNYTSGPFGLCVKGAGANQSQIISDFNSNALYIVCPYAGTDPDTMTQVVLQDFSILTTAAATAGNGIVLIGSIGIGSTAQCFQLRNLTISGRSGGYFCNGIYVQDCRNSIIENCTITGSSGVGAGIDLAASNNGAGGNAPCNMFLRGNTIYNFDYAIKVTPSGSTIGTNDYEGVMVVNNNLINNSYAFYASSSDDTGATYQFLGNVTNSSVVSCYMNNNKFSLIQGNYFQLSANGAIGVELVRSGFNDILSCQVIGNYFYMAKLTGVYAVVTSESGSASGSRNMIANNTSTAWSSAAYNIVPSDMSSNNY